MLYIERLIKIEKILRIIVLLLMATLTMTVLGTYVGLFDSTIVTQQGSELIQTELRSVIRNGGTWEEVQRIYERSGISTVSILEVLQDTKISERMTDSPDTELIARIDTIINESAELNPFGNLEENQRYLFEAVRYKSGTDYDSIEEDMNKIAAELRAKNIAVSDYLGNATLSLGLSLAALVLTILQMFYGMLPKDSASNNVRSLLERIKKWIKVRTELAEEERSSEIQAEMDSDRL